jgi:hypothetical protein
MLVRFHSNAEINGYGTEVSSSPFCSHFVPEHHLKHIAATSCHHQLCSPVIHLHNFIPSCHVRTTNFTSHASQSLLNSVDHKVVLLPNNNSRVWNRNVPICVKRIVFEAMVKSKLLYGCDIWWTGMKDV